MIIPNTNPILETMPPVHIMNDKEIEDFLKVEKESDFIDIDDYE
jgi:hypothetical protein